MDRDHSLPIFSVPSKCALASDLTVADWGVLGPTAACHVQRLGRLTNDGSSRGGELRSCIMAVSRVASG